MRVSELIEELQTYNGDLYVVFRYTEYGCCNSSEEEIDVEDVSPGDQVSYRFTEGPRGGAGKMRAVKTPVIVLR